MKILVTGGAGYLGSVLVPLLLREGHDVTVVDTFAHGVPSLAHVAFSRKLTIIREDARSTETLRRVRGFDVVIPLAAIVGATACDWEPFSATTLNRIAVEDIVEAATDGQMILYPCTNSGYGLGGEQLCTEDSPLTPLTLYGTTKVEGERAVLSHPYGVSFRLATLFGTSPRMRVDLMVNDFVNRAVRDRTLVMFEAHFRRNFLHVRDAASAFLHAINGRVPPGVYNVGDTAANMTKAQLADLICAEIPEFSPLAANFGADPDKRDYLVSNAKIESTGWKPLYTLRDGIHELAQAFRAMPYQGREWRNA